jgi:hypothetical protein
VTTKSFLLTVTPVNDAPTVSAIPNQTVAEDTPTAPLAFTISDIETPAASLVVTAIALDGTLVPAANLTIAGAGANRTLTITPGANQSGTTSMTVSVTDGEHTATTSFQLVVTPDNDAPTISAIDDQTTPEDTATNAIPFTVGDAETPAAALMVWGTSSNPTLVPHANITFGGAGASRTVTVTPAANQSGTATITVTVSDGSATASETFVLTVTATNDAPTITAIADQTTLEDTPTATIPFSIADAETPAASLT